MCKIKVYILFSSIRQYPFLLVYLCLVYCIIVWGGICSVHFRLLTILQKRPIRVISNRQYLAHSISIFLRLENFKPSDTFKLNVATYFYGDKINNYPIRSHIYNNRSSDNLAPEYQKTTFTQRPINYKGPDTRDAIPNYIKYLCYFNSFQRAPK